MARRIDVPREARGTRLDRFLAQALAGTPPDRVRELIEEGHVTIGGRRCQATRKLWGGEQIEVAAPAPRVAHESTEGPEIPILYEDESLVIVDKPPGLVVEPETGRPSVVSLLAARSRKFDVGGVAEPGVVHRLDRDTTGCLVLARHDESVAALKQAFAEHRIEKRYQAIVLGHPPERDRFDTPYGRDPKDERRFTTRVESARRAVLSYERLEQFREAALLDVRLETGRTHQIRVQLAEAGFPVLADAVYGAKEARTHPVAVALGRHALHSCRLAIQPRSIEAQAPTPADMRVALAALAAA